jgi:succinate dehydrogenase / fumarate reductase, cytochrome b subunit
MTVAAVYRTTIGKKAIMALTGFIWVGYVILHMAGNLKIYLGPNAVDEWAMFLRTFGAPVLGSEGVLWLVRLVLLASIVLHVVTAYQLTRLDLNSRPVRYSQRRYLSATISSRSMRWSGVSILVFMVAHILHMTTGHLHPDFIHPEYAGGVVSEAAVRHNLVTAFSNPLVTLLYILAMVALGLHLYHSTWSLLESLGINVFPKNNLVKRLAQLVAIVVPVGFASVPIAILLGFIR